MGGRLQPCVPKTSVIGRTAVFFYCQLLLLLSEP